MFAGLVSVSANLLFACRQLRSLRSPNCVLLGAFTTTTLEAEVLESFRIWLSKVSAKGAEYEFKVRRVTSRSSRTSTMSNTLVRLADLHRQ